MRSSFIAMLVTGAGVAVASTTHADVLLHLKSGGTIRAARTWTEGDTVNVQMGSDVASFASSAVESIEQLPGAQHPADAAAGSDAAQGAVKNATAPQRSAAKTGDQADAHAPGASAKPTPAAHKADLVPTVQGEDTATKLDRLDALSLQAHRALTIARHEGEPEEKLKALQENIDEINSQRTDAMRKLGRMH